MLYNIPRFCQFTTCYPGRQTASILNQSFRELLSIEPWTIERHLLNELLRFEAESQENPNCVGDWKETCRYIFKALASIPRLPQPRPWIINILRLCIYPITRRDGSKMLGRLTENIFIPDSALLNPLLQHKVDALDLEGQYVYTLIPLLKFANPPVKFLSSYDHDNNVKIPLVWTPLRKSNAANGRHQVVYREVTPRKLFELN